MNRFSQLRARDVWRCHCDDEDEDDDGPVRILFWKPANSCSGWVVSALFFLPPFALYKLAWQFLRIYRSCAPRFIRGLSLSFIFVPL